MRDNVTLDFEAQSIFYFLITASDGQATSLSVITQLSVTNINEAPRCSRQQIALEAQEGKVRNRYRLEGGGPLALIIAA